MRIFLLLTLLLFPSFVQADELKPEICGLLSRSINISNAVAYQAGVDAYGNAVVPADGRTGLGGNIDVVKMPLTIDLARRVQSLSGSNFELKSQMGMIEITNDGAVKYGDQDWTKQVKTLCGISHKEVIEATMAANLPKAIDKAKAQPQPQPAVQAPQIQIPRVPKLQTPQAARVQTPTATPVARLETPQVPKIRPPAMTLPQSTDNRPMLKVPKPVPLVQEQATQAMPNLLEEKIEAEQSLKLKRDGTRVKTIAQGSETINGGSYKDFNYNE